MSYWTMFSTLHTSLFTIMQSETLSWTQNIFKYNALNRHELSFRSGPSLCFFLTNASYLFWWSVRLLYILFTRNLTENTGGFPEQLFQSSQIVSKRKGWKLDYWSIFAYIIMQMNNPLRPTLTFYRTIKTSY